MSGVLRVFCGLSPFQTHMKFLSSSLSSTRCTRINAAFRRRTNKQDKPGNLGTFPEIPSQPGPDSTFDVECSKNGWSSHGTDTQIFQSILLVPSAQREQLHNVSGVCRLRSAIVPRLRPAARLLRPLPPRHTLPFCPCIDPYNSRLVVAMSLYCCRC